MKDKKVTEAPLKVKMRPKGAVQSASMPEDDLIMNMARYRNLIDSQTDIMSFSDLSGKLLFVNDAYCRLFKKSREDILGKNFAPMVFADDLQAVLQVLEAIKKPPYRNQSESRLVTPAGIRWFSWENSAVKNAAGKVIEFQGIGRDITEHKEAEEALKESEERFRRLTEVTLEGIVIHDGRHVIDANPAVLDLFGYELTEVIGKSVLEFVASESRDSIIKHLGIGSDKTIEAFGVKKDGSVFPLELKGRTMPYQGSMVRATSLRDITVRKNAEDVLARERELLRTLIDNLPDAIYVKDDKSGFLLANVGVARSMGAATPEELIGKTDHDYFPKELADQYYSDEQAVIHSGQPVVNKEEIIIHPDGSQGYILTTQVPLRNKYGEVTGLVGIGRDITTRKQEQAQFEILSKLPDESPNPILRTTANGILLYANQNSRPLLSLWDTQVGSPLPKDWIEKIRKVFTSGKYEEVVVECGKQVFSLILTPVTSAGYLNLYGRDITERMQAEKQTIRRMAQLETVSRISTTLRGARSVDEMLPLLLDETLKMVGTDAGEVWLHNSRDGRMRRATARGWLTSVKEEALAPGEGIVGWTFSGGEPYVSPDLIKDEHLNQAVLGDVPTAWGGICVPIKAENETIGVLCIYVPAPRVLGQEDANLLTTISEIAGNAIRRVRLYDETLHQVKRLAALRSMDNAISSVLDLHLVLDILLGHISKELGVDAADVLLLNPSSHMLTYAAGLGFHTSGITQSNLRVGEGLAGRAARDKTTVNVRDIKDSGSAFLRQTLLASESFVTYFGVPLISKGQVKGVLEVFHRAPLKPDPEWLAFLETLAGQAAIAVDSSQLFENLQSSNYEMTLAYDETIEGWSQALDLRDRESEGHSKRVVETTLRIAGNLQFTPTQLSNIRRGALLHDMGKLGVPDEILRKPGPLTDEEWVIMRRHPQFAYDMFSPIRYLQPALEIPYCHHEKWDGSGYPRGLKGDQIPKAARIFAVVDVWDALTSDRPYRKAWSEEKALEYIQEQSGKHFDPEVVALFLQEVKHVRR